MTATLDNSTSRSDRYSVVHILGSLQTGGAEMALVNYLRAADRKDFQHSVVCLSGEGPLARKVRDLGIPVQSCRVRLRYLLRDLMALARIFRQQQVAVVHTHMFSAAFWGRTAGLLAGVPVLVTTEHGKEPWKKGWQILLDRMLGSRTFRQIAVSEDVRSIRIQRDSAPPERIVLIPNGVPVPEKIRDQEVRAAKRAEFGLAFDQPVLGTVGRVVNAKAYPVLVEAMVLLREKVPGIRWLQVGDGPDLQALKELIMNRGLGDVIINTGRRDDVGDLLHAMDLWVMSSRREGLPVALLEAMAAGLPIVATRVGGIPDAVEDRKSAILVPPEDPIALAEGIMELLGDRQLGEQLGNEARLVAETRYGNIAVARKIEDIYKAGLNAKGLWKVTRNRA